MPETIEKLAEKLRQEGEKTIEFFLALPPVAWNITMYTDGADWTIEDILVHFVITEKGISQIVGDILGGGAGSPPDLALDEFNRKTVARRKDRVIADLCTEFGELRGATVRLVLGMNDEDLLKQGRHPFLGIASLEDILKLMYRHNQIHQRDIRRGLAAFESSSSL
jgi:hypothetical protein